ncbi:MBG domain-containing protein, partial [Levilactobacillus humaensis]|uniref:MBG domain-containing protein n=1 Tax=Levilactobacillus humaensis TaxID=2950375 RepID=UPI0021C35280
MPSFMNDIHNDGSDDTKVVDPGSGAYFGWRSTDANGAIQNVTNASDWKAASSFDLSNRATDPLIDFTMSYDSLTKALTMTIQNQTFTRSLADIDTSKGYSISIAASTGGQSNDYSAKIDSFTYTPKTASVNVKVATAAGDVSTTTPVTANIGDTISVFSTKEAAERAVAADPTLDPSLVTVIPASTTNNVYVVDGDQATASNGTVHASSLAAASYYSYKVTGDAGQTFSVPVSQAFIANVTPVDSVTNEAIPGVAPIQVTTVAGKSTVVQFPGYTPVTVELNAPADGETVANDKVKINTSTTPSTETDVANPIEHYYTATGETIDGTPVTANVTVGTNQSVTDALNATSPIGADGKPITDGSTPAYTWSKVPNAAGTDSTDKDTPQASGSILVPMKSTLDTWLQKATDNQTKADADQAKAQGIYDKFIAGAGITDDQKAAAKALLDSVSKMYSDLSTSNGDAKTALEAAEAATDPATIVDESQKGYKAMANMDDSLSAFEKNIDDMATTNAATQASLASFVPWTKVYGESLGFPDVTFGDGFGATVTDAQKDGFNKAGFFYYVDATNSDTQVTPKNVGTYYFKLTDDGRAYLKSLTPDNPNAGLYVSATLTITPAAATPTIQDTSVVYGAEPTITGSLGSDLANTDHPLKQGDFEIIDNATKKVVLSNQLQAGGDYTIQYTTDAQNTLKEDTNYTFGNFGTAKLTVAKRDITVTAPTVTKTYGDSLPATVSVTVNGTTSALPASNFEIVDATNKVVSANQLQAGGKYSLQLNADAQDTLKKANPNYTLNFVAGGLTVKKRPITVKINDVTTDYTGKAPEANGFSIAPDDKLVDGDNNGSLGITLNEITDTNVGTYAISGSVDSATNYAVTLEDGTLKILGHDVDSKKNETITEKDSADNVVEIDKKWADGSQTTYTYDPNTKTRTVTEKKDGKQVGEPQTFTSDSDKLTLADDDNTSTTVAIDPITNQPTFDHETTQTNGDTTTTKDAEGNVTKVVKTWPDDSQTTYTYDPGNGDWTVTEEKDGQTSGKKTFGKDDTQAKVTLGDGVDTIVNTAQPAGSQPTFEHDTTVTATDKSNNVTTATTTDDKNNVIKVVKTWTDGNQTTYTYDPATEKRTVSEQKVGQPVGDPKELTSDSGKVTLVDDQNSNTIVSLDPTTNQPTFDHEVTKTDGDTTTTTDASGNVTKVVKTWPDDSQTTYTYDPTTKTATVT